MTEAGTDAYYRLLCEHLGVALIATDRDLRIRTWNAAASRTLGAAAERMIGTSVLQILPRERRRLAERMLRRTMATGETIQLEFEHRDDRGRRRELAGTMAPVVTPSGERIGASICIRDITRRIELQNALHENRKMAALGEMAGAIAHHFNNILGGVAVSIDYAHATDDPARQRRALARVGPAIQRATTIVNGLLAFAEGDRRADDLRDVTEILNQLADEIEQRVQGRGIDFALGLPPLPVLPFPHGAVTTVLRNITRNAVEAMPDGGSLRIDASLSRGSLTIDVSDTGRGLDEAGKSRMFEPFWSTKGVAARGGEATGLGLAVAHGLVQMLGGSITVESRPGHGCRLRVTLPVPGGS